MQGVKVPTVIHTAWMPNGAQIREFRRVNTGTYERVPLAIRAVMLSLYGCGGYRLRQMDASGRRWEWLTVYYRCVAELVEGRDAWVRIRAWWRGRQHDGTYPIMPDEPPSMEKYMYSAEA